MDRATFFAAISSERVWYSIKLSFFTAAAAAFLSVVVAIPAAYALSRYEFRGKAFVDALLELPLIISPVALGAALLIFFNTRAGELIQNNFMSFVFEIRGIILAQFVTSAGVATRMIKSSLDEISPRYEMVARSLGATPFRSFMTVTLPLARKGILASAVITFAKCVGEFGATVTLAGSMPMKTETLPISIYLRLSGADIEGTVVFILILLFLGLVINMLSRSLGSVKYD